MGYEPGTALFLECTGQVAQDYRERDLAPQRRPIFLPPTVAPYQAPYGSGLIGDMNLRGTQLILGR
jgi:hypothetical protein